MVSSSQNAAPGPAARPDRRASISSVAAVTAAIWIVLGCIGPASAQVQTHAPCEDPKPFEKLKGWIEEYKGTNNEPDIRYLLALRYFVCEQIDAGHLRMPEATRLYDEEKARIFRKWKMHPEELTF
jgi:hypothetical protein